MKIEYVTVDCNWDSYSSMRCGFEFLRGEVERATLSIDKIDLDVSFDQLWLMGSGIQLTDDEFRKCEGKTVISFVLSAPCVFTKEKQKNCHIFCVNDLKTSIDLGCYWFPTFMDKKYHFKMNVPKVNDVMFMGIATHSDQCRQEVIGNLRKEGVRVVVYGVGWPPHPDNHSPITGKNLIEEINRSWLVLDLATEKSSMSHRIFEGLGCGTAVITKDRSDIRKMFQKGEILLYETREEVIKIIKSVIQQRKLLVEIGGRGRDRCLREHEVTVRIKELMAYINKEKEE